MAYEMLPGTRVPVRMWADPANVEPDALAQLRNVASLPWTRQVAVMPDVHYGKGATVGSDSGVLDEIPGAYKDIADVMARQADLVEVVHHLKQVVCVKG